MNKAHWIKDGNVGPTKVVTHCGLAGYREITSNDEFSTIEGNRFEAHKYLSKATCKRCLRSAKRITG